MPRLRGAFFRLCALAMRRLAPMEGKHEEQKCHNAREARIADGAVNGACARADTDISCGPLFEA